MLIKINKKSSNFIEGIVFSILLFLIEYYYSKYSGLGYLPDVIIITIIEVIIIYIKKRE